MNRSKTSRSGSPIRAAPRLYHLFKDGKPTVTEGGSITEGIGLARITPIIEDVKVDHAYLIPDEEAIPLVFDILEHEGLCLGGSSGINIAGAIRPRKGSRQRRDHRHGAVRLRDALPIQALQPGLLALPKICPCPNG